jgi:hypothetical protein
MNKNIYERDRKYNLFVLLNILEDEMLFKEFFREKYKFVDVNVSCMLNHTNCNMHFTNTLQDIDQIAENIKTTFAN